MEKYSQEVSLLISFKSSINFLYADCETFSHPLHHLGKSPKDCPLIAIDSFRHMYMFPNFDDINKPNKLKQFIQDLHSGKLHREFHHGPDTPSTPPPPPAQTAKLVKSPNKDPVDKKVVDNNLIKTIQPHLSLYLKNYNRQNTAIPWLVEESVMNYRI